MASVSLDPKRPASQMTGASPTESKTALVWRVLVATLVAWVASQVFNHWIIGEPLIPRAAVEGVSQLEFLALTLAASFLVAAAISYPATLSSLHGMALVQVLAIAHFGLNCLLTIVEATVFLTDMSASEVGLGVLSGAIDSVIIAVCITVAVGKMRAESNVTIRASTPIPIPWWEWLWKVIVCSFAYLVLYIAAGLLIFPLVQEYYPELDPEDIDPLFLIGLQLRRGVVYVACVVPLIRSMQASRWRIALTVGVLLPIVHGVAGLIVPSEHMASAAWRYAHMVEIGWSNFVFGLLIGYLFSRGAQLTAKDKLIVQK